MPFIAQKKNTKEAVRPADITDKFHKKEELECPHCGSQLTFRERATNKLGEKIRRAHFWHSGKPTGGGGSDIGGCEAGGESPEHEKNKLFALELLDQKYRETTFVEREIGDRVADCGVEFDRKSGDMRGVVVEVQFKNVDKDYKEVTKDYLKHGFGVHWVFITSQTWDHLYDAKDDLEGLYSESYYLGHIDPPEYELGELFWFNNFLYNIRDESDIIGEDHKKSKVKIEAPGIDESINAYLVLERDSIDQSNPELRIVGDILRERPAKSIANAKFD